MGRNSDGTILGGSFMRRQITQAIVQRLVSAMLVIATLFASVSDAAPSPAEVVASDPNARRGLCLLLDCCDPGQIAMLVRRGYVVHALALDALAAAEARQVLMSRGLLAKANVEHVALPPLPYADSIANVIVVQHGGSPRYGDISRDEIMRVLAPYGIAFVRSEGAEEWTTITKPYPPEMDEWQQYGHDASGSMVSQDRAIGPVAALRWIAGGYWKTSMAEPTQIVSAGGRVFFADMNVRTADEKKGRPARLAWLVARDAFNGLELWRRHIAADWAQVPRVVAVGDRVYAPIPEANSHVAALDAATGDILKTYGFGNGEFSYHNGLLLADRGQQAWSAETGRLQWETRVPDPPKRNLSTLGADPWHPFVADDDSIFYGCHDSIRCHSLASGQQRWTSPLVGDEELLFCHRGYVLTREWGEKPKGWKPQPVVLRALDAGSGSRLWNYDFLATAGKPRLMVFVQGEELWLQSQRRASGESRPVSMMVNLDLRTGREKNAVRSDAIGYRCHPQRATASYLIGTDGTMFEPATGKDFRTRALRGTCRFGYLPANGLMYQGLNKCLCYNSVHGLAAFARDRAPAEDPMHRRLETGEAAESGAVEIPADDGDWPTFRHDRLRTGCTHASIPTDLRTIWRTKLPGQSTSPVIAAGTVLVAIRDLPLVCALDGTTGAIRWTHISGGRVDSPPTYFAGRILFGSADGWLYCLRADNGQLLWRFRAAPAERRIVARGQVESVWPVHGSVLVDRGVAYVAAGRHTDTDGGIHVHAIDARTGRSIWQSRAHGDYPLLVERRRAYSALNRILLCDDHRLYLDQLIFDQKTGKLLGHSQADQAHAEILWGGALGLLNEEVLRYPYSGQIGGRKHWRYLGYDADLLAVRGNEVFGVVDRDTHTNDHTWRYEYRGWGKGAGKYPLQGNMIFGATPDRRWAHALDMSPHSRAKALLASDDKVFAAVACAAAGQTGGEIRVYSGADGTLLKCLDLQAAPAFGGLAAAGARLYVSTAAGHVICLGG